MKIAWTSLVILVAVLAMASAATAQDAGYRPEAAVSTGASVIRPYVVAIETRFDEPVLSSEYAFWQYFRGPRPLYGLWGSGFVFEDPEYVITASGLMDHVEFIRVILEDGSSYKAELVGENSDFNVAVLKVDWGPDMPVSPVFGDSDALKLGQPIGIVGKSLDSYNTFATSGIISAIRKEMPGSEEPTDEFLQFDASYQLSFVGGPIIDVDGKIVGMVDFTRGGVNLNLGVPINEVIRSANNIIQELDEDTWFGVETQFVGTQLKEIGLVPAFFDWDGDGTEEEVEWGMWISHVDPNSPAEIGGIRAGDVIVALDDRFIDSRYAWRSYVRDFRIGQLVIVEFLRLNEATGAWERMEAQVQIVEDENESDDDDNGNGGDSELPPGHP